MFYTLQDTTFLNKKELLRILDRFLELDKDFKKGEFPSPPDMLTLSSRPPGQGQAEDCPLPLQPRGKVPGTQGESLQVGQWSYS